MLENGWIKLHRSLLKWEWYDDVNTKAVFLHLLLTVNVEDASWHGIRVKRGSTITSYAKLAKAAGLTVQQVRTALNRLESTQSITRSANGKYTVISLIHYDKFQSSTQNAADSQQGADTEPTGCQQDVNNKVRKYKKDNKEKNDKKCNDTHHTAQEISELVYGMGYQWSEKEVQDFITYNAERGWKLSPETAAQKWEQQRQKQTPFRNEDSTRITEEERKNLEAYAALSNRFRF